MRSVITLSLLVVVLPLTVLNAQMGWVCVTDSASWGTRSNHASVVFDNKMWLIGPASDAWYSTDGTRWTYATDSAPWGPRIHHTLLVFDNKMWLIGGYKSYPESVHIYTDVWYSTDGAHWTCATDSADWGAYQLDHTSVVFDNKMWLIGGGNTNDVWYSTDGAHWTCATDSAPWGPRSGHTSVVFDNKMWLIGGWNGSTSLSDVWYSTDGAHWTCATDSADWAERAYASSVVFDNKMWLMCGIGLTGYTDVWYSTDGAHWTCATDSADWAERVGFSSVVFNNQIWIIGGRQLGHSLKDVWRSTSSFVLEEKPLPVLSVSSISITPTVIKDQCLIRLGQLRSSELQVRDVTGRLISTATISPSSSTVIWQRLGLTSGIYFFYLGRDCVRVLLI
jgi:hypothetical protein